MTIPVPPPTPKYAFLTFLLSTPTYLPGILVLAHTLKRYSAYPLIVAVNEAISEEEVEKMQDLGLTVRRVKGEGLVPKRMDGSERREIVERFRDVWLKLEVWGMEEFDKIILIDGDMMIRKEGIDEVFDIDIAEDEIAASHCCVCNLDDSDWAPSDWTRANCPYTNTLHPKALHHPPLTTSDHSPSSLLNAGLILLRPSLPVLASFKQFLAHPSELLDSWMFPEQDLLAHFYRGKWKPISWRYNALKTMRYWHGGMWRDEEVVNLHYICDKPWDRRPLLLGSSSSPTPPEIPPKVLTNPYHLTHPVITAPAEPPNPSTKYRVDHQGTYEHPLEVELGKPGEWADAVTHGWWWDEWEGMVEGMEREEDEFRRVGEVGEAERRERGRRWVVGLVAK